MRLAFDTKLKRPGCVLIQAAMDGDCQILKVCFPTETWLLAYTTDMKVYNIKPDELPLLIEMAIKATSDKKGPPRCTKVKPKTQKEQRKRSSAPAHSL